jgi:carboxypeptidase Q
MQFSRREFLGATAAVSVASQLSRADGAAPGWLAPYREPAARLIASALADASAWQRIAELTDTFGPRLSGSPALEHAIEWVLRTMEQDALERVRGEAVMVPHWVRGTETLETVTPFPTRVAMLGLGNSVGTPPEGIEADLLIVSSFEELESRGPDASGRIVLFDVPFTDYVSTVSYRTSGPSRAGAAGAVACLVRSIGPPGLRTPHTGMLRYDAIAPRIPAAAIALEDALRFARMQRRGQRVRLRLRMGAHMLPDTPSANVVGEWRGREKPNEVVVVSAHLDSWDVGAGAIDDAGGAIVAWEAVRLMRAMDLRPRRTVRAVLFANEENGVRGGLGYRDQHRGELAGHVLMLESDSGVFRPTGFGFSGTEAERAAVRAIASLLGGIEATRIGPAGGGADIEPSTDAARIPAMSLDVDTSKYFVYHHSEADTVDKLDPADVARCVAAVAVMAYVVADLPERLGEQS